MEYKLVFVSELSEKLIIVRMNDFAKTFNDTIVTIYEFINKFNYKITFDSGKWFLFMEIRKLYFQTNFAFGIFRLNFEFSYSCYRKHIQLRHEKTTQSKCLLNSVIYRACHCHYRLVYLSNLNILVIVHSTVIGNYFYG